MENCEVPIVTAYGMSPLTTVAKDTTGDRICLFGFSRGGYTARALACMLHRVGLLPAGNHRQIETAFKLFKRADDKINPDDKIRPDDETERDKKIEREGKIGGQDRLEFRRSFCNHVDVEFLGVWYACLVRKKPLVLMLLLPNQGYCWVCCD